MAFSLSSFYIVSFQIGQSQKLTDMLFYIQIHFFKKTKVSAYLWRNNERRNRILSNLEKGNIL